MRKKLIVTYLIILSLPVLLINVYFFWSALPAVRRQADQINAAAVRQTAANITSKLNELLVIPSVMSTDVMLLIELGAQQKNERAYVNYYTQLRPALTQYRAILPYSVTLNIVSDNENLYREIVVGPETSIIKRLDAEISAQTWYKRAVTAKGDIIIDQNTQGQLVIAQWMNARLPQKNRNICYIEVPEFEIRNIYHYDAHAQNKRYFLLSASGRVLSSTVTGSIGRQYDELNETTSGVYEEAVRFTYGNETLRLICAVPDPYISKQIHDLQRMALLFLGLSLSIGIIAILLISRTMTKRLMGLSQDMQDFQQGRTPLKPPRKAARFPDEIDDLSQRFGALTHEIDRLIQEVVQVEVDRGNMALAVKEARLQALQSQINPHFLFNFMDNVRTGLLRSGERDTAEIIRKFTVLLRRSIDFSPAAALTPLQKEIEFVTMYLELQKYRYRERLSYDISVDEDCGHANVPRFLLQPLVENAIIHGMEGVIRPCHIRLHVKKSGDFMEITVMDDGRGFLEGELLEVRRMLAGEAGPPDKYIGLRNVKNRLELLNPSSKGVMEIQSAPGQGAVVKIRLYIEDGREEANAHVPGSVGG